MSLNLFTQNSNVCFCHCHRRNLLTFYSWTGLSRIKHMTKNPFNKLVHILSLFYEVISYADASFSHRDKEEFFRDGVLKHSFERNKPKRLSKKIQIASAAAEMRSDRMRTAATSLATSDDNSISIETSIREVMQQFNEDTERYDCEEQES